MSSGLISTPTMRLRRWAGAVRAATAGGSQRAAAPIGLDIGAERLQMVQFSRSSARPQIRAAISLPYSGGRQRLLDEPARLRALVRQALASRPFRGRDVVSCLAASEVKTMMVSYQVAAGQGDAAAILRELRERLKTELDSAVVDYLPIRNDDSPSAERSAIVAVAARERVVAYLDALYAAGLRPTALDIGPAALARLVAALDRAPEQSGSPDGAAHSYANALLLNFGQARSYVSLVWGRRLMLDREIDFGETKLVQRLSNALSLTESESLKLLHERPIDLAGRPAAGGSDDLSSMISVTMAEVLRPELATLAHEINKTLIYTASKTRGRSVDRIYLLGSVARYPGIAAVVHGLASIPVEVVDPLGLFGLRPDAIVEGDQGLMTGLAVATGLALRGRADHG